MCVHAYVCLPSTVLDTVVFSDTVKWDQCFIPAYATDLGKEKECRRFFTGDGARKNRDYTLRNRALKHFNVPLWDQRWLPFSLDDRLSTLLPQPSWLRLCSFERKRGDQRVAGIIRPPETAPPAFSLRRILRTSTWNGTPPVGVERLSTVLKSTPRFAWPNSRHGRALADPEVSCCLRISYSVISLRGNFQTLAFTLHLWDERSLRSIKKSPRFSCTCSSVDRGSARLPLHTTWSYRPLDLGYARTFHNNLN